MLVAGLLLVLMPSHDAAADGFARVATGVAGPFELSVLLASSQPRAGPGEWSVLVKDARDGELVLDARVEIALHAPSASSEHGHPLRAVATRSASANRMLYTARIAPTSPGPWHATVRIASADLGSGELSFPVMLASAPAPLLEHWRAFAVPPLALGLFALQQWRVHRRSRSR